MWTKNKKQNFKTDHRGWQKGKRRKWTKADEKKIKTIHKELDQDKRAFYLGATAIEQRWREKYANISPPPLITIGRMTKELGLSIKRKKGKNKGAAKYLCYPEHTIYTLLNGRVLEIDFIGKKYLAGRTEPLNFIAFAFKKQPRLRYFKRVESQTSNCFTKESTKFFKKF